MWETVRSARATQSAAILVVLPGKVPGMLGWITAGGISRSMFEKADAGALEAMIGREVLRGIETLLAKEPTAAPAKMGIRVAGGRRGRA